MDRVLRAGSVLLLAGFTLGSYSAWAVSATSTVEGAVEVAVHSPDGAIDDLRGGRVLLLVRNLADEDLLLAGIEPVGGVAKAEVEYVFGPSRGCEPVSEATAGSKFDACIVPPGRQALIPVEVDILALERAGKTAAVFDIEYLLGDDRGNVLAVAELTLGVFGEHEIAPLLQVPSVLVLPGALFLVALTLLWRLGFRPTRPTGKDGKDDFPVKPSGLEFWASAVLVSISLLVWRGWRTGRNLLQGYGYADVMSLSLLALGLATLVGVTMRVVRFERERRNRREQEQRAQEIAKRTVKSGDDALAILSKLTEWGAEDSLTLPAVRSRGKTLVQYLKTDGDGTVVGPKLVYALTRTAPRGLDKELQGLRDADKIVPLARRLLEERSKEHVTVRFQGGGGPADQLTRDELESVVGPQKAIDLDSRDENGN
jgi:hypothetical protein